MDHNFNSPDPIALSSAEAEYNECCLAGMATNHLSMLLDELELRGLRNERGPITVYLNISGDIAMGNGFKDTKHTRHIMDRYHFVREGVAKRTDRLVWVETERKLADNGTKQTPRPRRTFLVTIILVPLVMDSSAQEG